MEILPCLYIEQNTLQYRPYLQKAAVTGSDTRAGARGGLEPGAMRGANAEDEAEPGAEGSLSASAALNR